MEIEREAYANIRAKRQVQQISKNREREVLYTDFGFVKTVILCNTNCRYVNIFEKSLTKFAYLVKYY